MRVHYTDAAGNPAHVPPGGHVDVTPSRGSVQWQPRARYGDPAAIVRVSAAGPLRVRVTSDIPRLPRVLSAQTDTRAWGLPPAIARALGPHAVVVGWFPTVTAGVVEIVRSDAHGSRRTWRSAAPTATLADRTVEPGASYTYEIRAPARDPIDVGASVPLELPAAGPDAMRGKAMWLTFDDSATHWNVAAMLDRARAAGLRTILLRMCYGEYDELTPLRRHAIDAFIDGAAQRGIGILAWTVPRAVSYEDLAANVGALAYRTAAGNGPRGLAVDLERGPDFLGTGEPGRIALRDYLAQLRAAVGPRALLVATVEDPQLEGLTESDVPYATIAAAANVIQPMVYWRARRAGTSIVGMRAELAASYSRLRELVGPTIAIDIGGQTADLGNGLGPPPPAEVVASLGEARRLGAIGEAFFDWDGTSAAQWAALGAEQ